MAIADIHLRTASRGDAEALAAIEEAAFPDPSWSGSDFLRYDCTVAEIGSKMAGFLVSRQVSPGEREILNLAVALECRRLGVAACLVAHELQRGETVFLEVRESNVVAIHLYKKAGFHEISRRPGYYDNPLESAIVMRMK